MSWEKARRLVQLTEELVDIVATAKMCADEIHAIAYAEFNGNESSGDRPGEQLFEGVFGSEARPRIDHTTLSVVWAGKNCFLGYTISFKLVNRLAQRPNHFVTEMDLLRDVWDGDQKSPNTIRSAIRHLKQRLQAAGMDDLAVAIQGEGGRYALLLRQ